MRFLYLLLTILIFFTGCTSKEVPNNEPETFNIVTSFYPIYVFTENVVKDVPDVKLSNMTNSHTGCLHDYQLSTADMKLLDSADTLIINGAGMESFLEKAYTVKDNLNVIDTSSEVELLKDEFSDEYNEHIWLNISDAILQVRSIGNSLAELDSKNKELYLKNTEEYINKLEALRNELREEMYGYDEVNLITSSNAFLYFADDFEFDILGVIEKEEGASPTSKEMQAIIDLIKENEIQAIFIEEDTSPKIAKTIASESEARVYNLDTITYGDGKLDDYEIRMRENIKVIKESL